MLLGFIAYCIFYTLCAITNAKTNVFLHFIIFSLGCAWYISEKYILQDLNDNQQCLNPDYIYKNIYEPKAMDILFNSIGQLLYFIVYTFNK